MGTLVSISVAMLLVYLNNFDSHCAKCFYISDIFYEYFQESSSILMVLVHWKKPLEIKKVAFLFLDSYD